MPAPDESTPAGVGPLEFVCPHCGADPAPLVVQQSVGEMPAGRITYAVAFCGVESCRRIFSVTVLTIETNDALLRRARRAGLVF